MQRSTRTRLYIAAAAVVAVGGIGTGIAAAAGGDPADERPDVAITGANLDRASAAALAHTGGGRVTETEVGDEESLYEVEVTLDDGTQVDVQLDADFRIAGSESDSQEDGSND